jgi:hypothetical protein
MRSLRVIQIAQLTMIMMSMKKVKCSWFLKERMISKGLPAGTTWLNRFQHEIAKGELRNRCSRVSSTWCWQSTQAYEGRILFFLLRISRVLGRSFSNIQKKTLCFSAPRIPKAMCSRGELACDQWDDNKLSWEWKLDCPKCKTKFQHQHCLVLLHWGLVPKLGVAEMLGMRVAR